MQALDYSVSTEKPLIHHLTSAMDDGRLGSDPGYNGRLGHVYFGFRVPALCMPAAHSLSFGGARLASYIMGRCLTIPKSRVTDSAVESNAQAMPNIKKKRKIFKEHALCDFVKVNKDPLLISTPLHFNSLITKPNVGMPKPSSSTQNYAKITSFLHCPSKTSLKSENNGTILW